MSWDPFQRALLAELGHVLYRPLGAAVAAPQASPAGDAAMLARLAKAAGQPLEALLAQADLVAASARLQGDGAAKRALWPRLRALRRGRP